jgi:hypothetical protein
MKEKNHNRILTTYAVQLSAIFLDENEKYKPDW